MYVLMYREMEIFKLVMLLLIISRLHQNKSLPTSATYWEVDHTNLAMRKNIANGRLLNLLLQRRWIFSLYISLTISFICSGIL